MLLVELAGIHHGRVWPKRAIFRGQSIFVHPDSVTRRNIH
jgi:hypothetical protein